ncbi:MAG: hypothetical protein M3014_07295, partial [Chloroflexota bacterium]|nr:hypothetical protein [Chloroflexota bacterium]
MSIVVSTTSKAPPKRFLPRAWHRFHLGALLAHIFLSLFFTWPLALNFLPGAGSLVPGTMLEDRDQNLWNIWWVSYAFQHGHNPYVTNLLWYPTPISLYYHTLNIFNGLLALPLLPFLKLTTVYNIVVLFSFVMGAYGAFLLVRYLCGNRWAALVGSVVFAYSAYHIATMRSLLQLISLEWVPFFIFFLLRAVYSESGHSRRDIWRWLVRRSLPAAISLLLISLVDWYYTMYALMLAGLLGLYTAVRYVWERHRKVDTQSAVEHLLVPWIRIGVCIGIYALLVSPILIPTLRELRQTNYMLPEADAALSHSADLMAFFQPERTQLLWGRFFTDRNMWPFGSERYEVYFSYTALFLAGVGLFATRLRRPRVNEEIDRQADASAEADKLPGKWYWASCALIFFVLALGPVLQINGAQINWLFSPRFPLTMPYNFIANLPLLNISRSPDRFDMPLTLCLGVLTGYGTNVLMGTWWRKVSLNRRGLLILSGTLAFLVVELTPIPYPQRPADVPKWYYQLAKEEGDFSILDLPTQDDYWHGAYRMLFQTVHAKRIFGGYISREFPHPFLVNTPGYQELTYADGAGDMFKSGPAEWLSAMQQYDTRYVVLQKVRLPDKIEPRRDVGSWREAIARVFNHEAPTYADDQVEVYRVPQPAQRVA